MNFKPDCANCKALCCISTGRDGPYFNGFPGPLGQPCSALCTNFQCRVHDSLSGNGMRGCQEYTCYGIGQRLSKIITDAGVSDIRQQGTLWEKDVASFINYSFGKFDRMMYMLTTASSGPAYNELEKSVNELLSQLSHSAQKRDSLMRYIPYVDELYLKGMKLTGITIEGIVVMGESIENRNNVANDVRTPEHIFGGKNKKQKFISTVLAFAAFNCKYPQGFAGLSLNTLEEHSYDSAFAFAGIPEQFRRFYSIYRKIVHELFETVAQGFKE